MFKVPALALAALTTVFLFCLPAARAQVTVGVNIGPNLTYTGSLATLLWRRELRERGCDVSLAEFTRLGMLTVIPSLALCVLALWAGLHIVGGLASA